MVMIDRPNTHIYHMDIKAPTLDIGKEIIVAVVTLELYDKSLVLTSDIKKLPYLLGGSLKVFHDVSLRGDLAASGLGGVATHAILMNGDWSAILNGELRYQEAILDVPSRQKEILLVAHSTVYQNATIFYFVVVTDQAPWDFEGEHILYDTISLVIFADVDTAVGGTPLGSYSWSEAILEIDWKDINKKELDDYIREHIFARAGDLET